MDRHDRLRELIADFDWDPDWLPAAARAMTEAAHRAVPDLYRDQEISAGTFDDAESIVRQVLYMVQNAIPPEQAQLPPQASEQARQLVRRGAPLEELLRAYQVSHAAFYAEWARMARQRLDDPAELVEALELGAAWTFEYVEAVSAQAVARYREEADRWVRSAAAVRKHTVDSLLSGEGPALGVAAGRLGYELDRSHLAFVVWAAGPELTPDDELLVDLEVAGERFAASFSAGRPLLVPLGTRMLAGWAVPRAAAEPRRPGAEGGLRVATGAPGAGLAGFRASHEQALEARRVAVLRGAAAGSLTAYREVAMVALASADAPQAHRFVAEEVGPLLARGAVTGDLVRTLRAFLEEGMSPRRAAARLGVHENTVANRVRAAEELLGRPVAERPAELELALRLVELDSQP